ncbi:MAG: hypothetical protein Q8L39_09180 [Burkholderiales bacterium]|nr:hypothetical protein [Burkholderiales bacterium]
MESLQKHVMPTQAGIQDLKNIGKSALDWIPALRGDDGLLQDHLRLGAVAIGE